MKTDNFIKCYEALREEIGNLCKWDWEIREMKKHKANKKLIEKEKTNLAMAKEHFRGMVDMANLTGEFTYPDGRSSIDSEFGWYFQ